MTKMIHLQPYSGEYCSLCLFITNIDDSNSNTQQDTRKDDRNNDIANKTKLFFFFFLFSFSFHFEREKTNIILNSFLLWNP